MNLHEIPYKVMVTMPQCSDRRWRLHGDLCNYGINDVIAEHPIPLHEINHTEYAHLPQKALPYISQILTLKKVIGDARQRKASSLWIFEDDAVLHPEFLERARRLRVPNNWRFLYLGGAYYNDVVRINDSVVRPSRTLDLHCVVISSEMYDVIEDRFEATLHDRTKKEVFADVIFADLHKNFPAYLCRPNLSWQSNHASDLNGKHYSSYKPNGEQWHKPTKLPFTAVYSLWTKGDSAWAGWAEKEHFVKCFMQSAYLAQKHFSRVVLYTDTAGKELLKHVYFDDVFVTLDKLEINPVVSCAGKLDTLTRQSEPFVYLEPEIFLHSGLRTTDDKIVVAQGVATEAEQSESADWLRGLEWKPNFVREILGQRRKVEIGNFRILGGRDVEFFKWYGAMGLEILRRPENAQYMENLNQSTGQIATNALNQWLVTLCATYRGKKFCSLSNEPDSSDPLAKKRRSNRMTFTQIDPAKRRANDMANEIDLLNQRAGLLAGSSTKLVQFAKNGRGWYVDLQNVGYKVVTGISPGADWQYLRAIYAKLGIMCEPHIPDSKEKAIPGDDGEAAELRRQIGLLKICAQARKRNTEEFLILQNGTLFHNDIQNLIFRICVPLDWQFFYLAGNSVGNGEWVGRGVMKSDHILGLDAVLIRKEAIEAIERVLAPSLQNGETCDARIGSLHKEYPAYLSRPQLAWLPPESETVDPAKDNSQTEKSDLVASVE